MKEISLTGTEAPALDENPAPARSSAPVHVLVVDDDPDINRLLRARLRSEGCSVGSAANGEQALDYITLTPPDLIFLDMSILEAGGMDVLESVRSRGLDMAVVMTTAFGSEQAAIEALRQGADDYLRKPFEATEFRAVLRRATERLELTRQNARLRAQLDQKRRQLESELTLASRVQADLLPGEALRIPGFELAARCVPAREVGGDFYDWEQPIPGSLTLVLADIMGKGMPAALLMATVRAAMRAVIRHSPPLSAIGYVSAALEHDLTRIGSFVTLFLAKLDIASRRLTYIDAGHGLSLLIRDDATVEGLPSGGLPLGVMPDSGYESGEVTLSIGDTLILFSDGLLDAITELAADPLLLAHKVDRRLSAGEIVDQIMDLAGEAGSMPDDLTVVVLRCTGLPND